MSDQAGLAIPEAQVEAAPAARGEKGAGKAARAAKGAGKAADKAAKGKDGKEKPGKAKKGKAKKGAAGGVDAGALVSVASHPRASRHVRLAKGWGGLAGFGLTAYLSLAHGVSADLAGLRALGAGAAGYVVAWGCSVMVWRQLMVAELRASVERARAAERARAEQADGAASESATR